MISSVRLILWPVSSLMWACSLPAGRCPRLLQEALADRLELAPSRQHEHGRVRFCKDTRQETPTVRQLRILNEFAPFASMAPVPSWSGRFAVTPSKWARGVRARRMKDACDERTTADTGYGSGGTSRRHRRRRRQDSA